MAQLPSGIVAMLCMDPHIEIWAHLCRSVSCAVTYRCTSCTVHVYRCNRQLWCMAQLPSGIVAMLCMDPHIEIWAHLCRSVSCAVTYRCTSCAVHVAYQRSRLVSKHYSTCITNSAWLCTTYALLAVVPYSITLKTASLIASRSRTPSQL